MKILVVSNMYPNKKFPSAGIFVKRFCDELEKIHVNYDLSVMLKHVSKIGKVYGYLSFYFLTAMRVLFIKYDVIYIHYASHSSAPVVFLKNLKKLRIYTNVHGSDVVPENSKQEKFQKYTLKSLEISEKIIVPSEYFKEYVSSKYTIDRNKIIVYPSCGVDRKVFYELSDEQKVSVRKKYNLHCGRTVFSFVGRISEKKGWDTYLKAISILVNNGYEADFVFVGDGIEAPKYEKLIEELKLKNYILKFPLMTQKELVEIYNCSNAFVFPTEREGESLGLVALEAMACGTPVIASDYAAPKYYIKNGYNGLKYKVGEEKELAQVMIDFINNKYEKKNFHEGVEKTAEEYSNSRILQRLHSIFK